MTTIKLSDMLDNIRRRKASLGYDDSPAAVERMRNKGSRRTPAKRQLLRRNQARARAAGVDPVISH